MRDLWHYVKMARCVYFCSKKIPTGQTRYYEEAGWIFIPQNKLTGLGQCLYCESPFPLFLGQI